MRISKRCVWKCVKSNPRGSEIQKYSGVRTPDSPQVSTSSLPIVRSLFVDGLSTEKGFKEAQVGPDLNPNSGSWSLRTSDQLKSKVLVAVLQVIKI